MTTGPDDAGDGSGRTVGVSTSSGAAQAPGSDGLDDLRSTLQRDPGNHHVRLRLAARLFDQGEWSALRQTLAPFETVVPRLILDAGQIDPRPDPSEWAKAMAWLARVDEQEGHLDRAIHRWETMLADNVDHPEARANLARVKNTQAAARTQAQRPGPQGHPVTEHFAGGQGGPMQSKTTLVSPEGTKTTRHEILKELGRGATSTVFLARDHHLGILVALKVLHPAVHAAARTQSKERFFWEARVAARLRHPGVVAVYDLDEAASALAMEYLPAGTLRARLSGTVIDRQPGPLPATEILSCARRLLATLVYVHGTGLIHGDIKPRNILLRRPGEPVLGDFGVARLVQEDHTRTPTAGTPLYLAPEQLRGAGSSVQTDLFAVGAILWEMAAGRPMRTHTDLTSGRHDPGPLPDTAIAHLDDLANRIAPLVQALIQRDPSHRPEDAACALRMLEGGG